MKQPLEMLKNTGKAAIIHPTGTGKSFIGFKLCEQFPDKQICKKKEKLSPEQIRLLDELGLQ